MQLYTKKQYVYHLHMLLLIFLRNHMAISTATLATHITNPLIPTFLASSSEWNTNRTTMSVNRTNDRDLTKTDSTFLYTFLTYYRTLCMKHNLVR